MRERLPASSISSMWIAAVLILLAIAALANAFAGIIALYRTGPEGQRAFAQSQYAGLVVVVIGMLLVSVSWWKPFGIEEGSWLESATLEFGAGFTGFGLLEMLLVSFVQSLEPSD